MDLQGCDWYCDHGLAHLRDQCLGRQDRIEVADRGGEGEDWCYGEEAGAEDGALNRRSPSGGGEQGHSDQ